MKIYEILYSFGGSTKNWKIGDKIIDTEFKLALIEGLNKKKGLITVKYLENGVAPKLIKNTESINIDQILEDENILKKQLIDNILTVLKLIPYEDLEFSMDLLPNNSPPPLGTEELIKIPINLNKLEIIDKYGVGIKVRNNMPISSVSNDFLNPSQNDMPLDLSLTPLQNDMPTSSVSNNKILKHELILVDLDIDFYEFFLEDNKNLLNLRPNYLKFYKAENYAASHSLAGDEEKPFPLFPIIGFINYSKNPNCYNYFSNFNINGKSYWIGHLFALRDIEEGEELTTGYFSEYTVLYNTILESYPKLVQTDLLKLPLHPPDTPNTFVDFNQDVINTIEIHTNKQRVPDIPYPRDYINKFIEILSMGDDINSEYIADLNPSIKYETFKLLREIYEKNENKIKVFIKKRDNGELTADKLAQLDNENFVKILANKFFKLDELINNNVFDDVRTIKYPKIFTLNEHNLSIIRSVFIDHFIKSIH